jgi:hypothetical protein
MKEFITHKHKKKNISVYSYRFTDEEKEVLQWELKKYDSPKAQHFISELEELCSEMIILIKHTDRKAVKKRKDKMIGHFEKALDDLKFIESLKGMREYWEDMKSIFAEDYSRVTSVMNFETWKTIMFAINNLEEIIALLKKDEIPTGNRVDPFGFATTIAEMFALHLEKPTTYRDGPFSQVVRIALNAIGIEIEDPARHVALAIENLN